MIDMVVVGFGCLAALQADSALLPDGIRRAGGPALIVLAILFVWEGLTGLSAGKLVMRLRVVRTDSDGRSLGRATVPQTVIRAALRWVGPVIVLASMLTKEMLTAALLVAFAMMIVVCQIPICYITLFRKGGTVFDLCAGTRVEAVQTA
jgi:hypothetical protein